MKKFLTMMCAVLALSFIFCTSGTVTEAKTAAYTSTITKDYRINWSNGTKKIYLNKKGNKLYCKNFKTGKTQLLKKLKIEADSDQSYMISYVYGNNIYLSSIRGAGDGDTYTYNMKTKTYKCLKKNFIIQSTYGKYVTASYYMPTDITPYASYVYEITSNGVKKVTRLAKNTTCAMFINNNIYYTSYPQSENTEGSEMYTVKVYKCKKDGTNKKCIFTRKLDDKNSYVLVQTITENTIHFVETTEEGKSTEFVYDCATHTIEKSTEK